MPDQCALANRIGFIQPIGGNTIKFQFMPEDVSDSKSANYNETEIMARSMPLMGWSSSGARQLSFTLQFYKTASYEPLDTCNELRALCYGNYNGQVAPPPVCIVQIGRVRMKGVMTQCDITYKHPWWTAAGEEKPMYSEVSVTFAEVHETPWSYKDVIAGDDMYSF